MQTSQIPNLALTLALAFSLPRVASAQRGDADGDGRISVLDLQRTVNHILSGDRPRDALDLDRDGRVDVRDVQAAANVVLRDAPVILAARDAGRPGEFVQVSGVGFAAVDDVRLGDAPTVWQTEGPNALLFQVPPGQGDALLHVRAGGLSAPPFPFRVLCPECQPAPAHALRWPAAGAQVAGVTTLILASPDFGRDDSRVLEAFFELDDQRLPVPLTPATDEGPASHATRLLMDLPDTYGLGLLHVLLADGAGRLDHVVQPIEVFPAPSFLPDHEPLVAQAGLQLRLPPDAEGASLGAVSLADGARYADFVEGQGRAVGAWVGLPPGDYVFFAEAMTPRGLVGASALGRLEYDAPTPLQLDLAGAPALDLQPGDPRVVAVASVPLTRRPGATVTLRAITNQPLEAPQLDWIIGDAPAVRAPALTVVVPDDALFVQVAGPGLAGFAATLPSVHLPGAPDRDARPTPPPTPSADYLAFDCADVGAVMARTEFASARAAGAFGAFAESIGAGPDCTAFVGWADPSQLAGFEPVAWLDGELPITELCVADSVCGGCSPFGAGDLEVNTVGSFKGICGVLSVAHSLVYKLGVVSEADALVDRDGDGTRETWNGDLLNRIRRKSGHDAARGTTVSGEQDAYEDFDNGEDFDIECGGEQEQDDYDWDGGTVDADELQAWCEGLDQQADEDDEDCTFLIRGETSALNADGSGKYAGHAMHIKSVNWDAATGTCQITTVDTGIQSANHNGDDVPANPGEQTWHVSTSGTAAVNVILQPGSSSYRFFATQFVWSKARSYCCSVER